MSGFDPYQPAPYPPPPMIQLRIPQAKPLWSYALLAVNVLVFAASLLLGQEIILWLGAKNNQAIVAGEVWRLVTAMFLHVDVLHILFNSYALLIFGVQVERLYGRPRFLLTYFLGGLAGSAFSFLLSARDSVGASGAIFGLIGVMGAYLFRHRKQLSGAQARLTNILFIAGYNLFYGFVAPRVDNWAHIGGLLAGLALGWFLSPNYEIVQLDPATPPRVVDRNAPAQWLPGTALVTLGIFLVLLGGFLRWS